MTGYELGRFTLVIAFKRVDNVLPTKLASFLSHHGKKSENKTSSRCSRGEIPHRMLVMFPDN